MVESSDDEVDEEIIMINNDITVIQRTQSETALLPIGVIRPESPSDEVWNLFEILRTNF
jgi:hypothetical protein